jgi:lipopolysaccharide transport system ATP-binding protein
LTKIYGQAGARQKNDWITRAVKPLLKLPSIILEPALREVSVTIHEGERVGVIGENGAGKSTLLSIIAGVLEPTSGSVSVDGKVLAALSVGLGERDELTGRENLYLNNELGGRTREQTESVIDEMIEFVDIGDFIDLPMRTYSTGMRARISFANLVFSDPEILIVDETLSVGDHKFGAKAARALERLCDRGKIVLIVSHGLDTLSDLCDRCIWLKDGMVKMDGAPREVVGAYRDFVRLQDEEKMASAIFQGRSDSSVREIGPIESLTFDCGALSAPQWTFEESDTICARLTLQIGAKLLDPDVRIVLRRLDGVALVESRLRWNVAREEFPPGPRRVTIDLGQAYFKSGIYQVDCEVFESSNCIGKISRAVKIMSSQRKGGEPALTVNGKVHPSLAKTESGLGR